MKKRYSLVLLSGGSGTRMQMALPKQYLMLAGKPVIVHVLECIDKIDEIDEIVVCANPEYHEKINEYIINFNLKKSKYKIINAGETRQETAYLGVLNSKNQGIVIHEAARPFISPEMFKELLDNDSDSVIYGVPIPFTVSIAEEVLKEGLERDKLINVQLPQKFLKSDLLEGFEKALNENKIFTEESSLLNHYFKEKVIKVLKGHQYNLKITYPLDLRIGEIILNEMLNREDI